jgi:hypothetical protein
MIIQLTSEIQNISLQVGDIAYYTPVDQNWNSSGADLGVVNPVKIGVIDEVGNNYIKITNYNITPPVDSFLMFAKDNTVNKSGVKGYFAQVDFAYNDVDKAELFSVAAEVKESSK